MLIVREKQEKEEREKEGERRRKSHAEEGVRGCNRKLRDEGAEKETKASTRSEVLVWLHADHLLAKAFGAFLLSSMS